MTAVLAAILAAGIAVPHVLRLERSAPVLAATLWLVSLTLRALAMVFLALSLLILLPTTQLFEQLTHWCLHLPLIAARVAIEGHTVGDVSTVLPSALMTISLLSVAVGISRAARSVRRMLLRESLGPGPRESVIVRGSDVMLAVVGFRSPRVLVSAGALLQLDDEELAAGLDHERGHIVRRHRYLLAFGELCHSTGRWIPGGRRAVRELAFHLERDADRWAAARNDRLALASAICKAAAAPAAVVAPFAASLAGTRTRQRLQQLLENPPASRERAGAFLLSVLTTTMVAATVAVAALLPSVTVAQAERFHDHAPIEHCEH